MLKKCLGFLMIASAIFLPVYAEFSEVLYDFSGATIPSEFYVWGDKTSIVDGAICIDTALQTEYTSWDGFKYNFPVGVNKSNTEKVIVEYDFKVPRTAGTSLAAAVGGTSGINYLGGLMGSKGRIASFDTSANAYHLQAWVNNSTLSGSLYNFGTQADPSQYIRLRTEYNFANNTYRSYKDGQLLTNSNGVADFAMVADQTALEVRFATPYPMKTLYIDNLKITTVKPMKLKAQTVADFSQNVPIDAKPQFTFDDTLDSETLSEVKLYKGTVEVPTQNTVALDTLTLVPTSDLEYLTDYKIEITSKLKGAYGEGAVVKTISFKTAQLPFYAKDLTVLNDTATVKFINNTANIQYPIILLCSYNSGILTSAKIVKITVPTGGAEVIGSAVLAGVTNAYVLESTESMGLILSQ